MSCWETLLELDRTMFQWINGACGNALFDAVLPFMRERWFWAPFYLFILAFTWINYGRRARYIVLGMVLCVALADFTSSTLIKMSVQRLRPCKDPAMTEKVVMRVSCGGGYSFTSSHAANHFAVAVFLIGVFGGISRWVRPALLFWAGLIAFSQVYVGVHYPADVIVGALLGASIAWGIYRFMAGRGAFISANGR